MPLESENFWRSRRNFPAKGQFNAAGTKGSPFGGDDFTALKKCDSPWRVPISPEIAASFTVMASGG